MRHYLFLAVVAAGCGDVFIKDDMSVSPAPDLAPPGGDDGGSPDQAPAHTDLAPANTDLAELDDADVNGQCTLGIACNTATGKGFCKTGTCSPCVDPTDDAACKSLYGNDHLCIKGACIKADCRTNANCGSNVCSAHQCIAKCTDDSDCFAPPCSGICVTVPFVCNTATGLCVTNRQCGSSAVGDPCPVNAADLCCSVIPGGKQCLSDVDCCGSGSACTAAGGAAGTCTNFHCIPNTALCTAPAGTTRYVDYGGSYPARIGSKDCPYNSVHQALLDLTGTGGKVIVHGTSGVASSSRQVPDNTDVVGGTATLDECTPATCADPNSWPVLKIAASRRGFDIETSGSHHLAFLQLVGPGGAPWSGILVNGANATLDHLRISGFSDGIHADTGSNVTIKEDVQASMNDFGLVGSDATKVTVSVDASLPPTSFNNNAVNGILITGSTVLSLTGATKVQATANGADGLSFGSSSASQSLIDGLDAEFNGMAGGTAREGLAILSGTNIKVRNGIFANNAGVGVALFPGSTTSVANIDLGSDAASNPGNNRIHSNTYTGLCVTPDLSDAIAASNGAKLRARGNLFDILGVTKNCQNASPMAPLHRGVTCTKATDISDHCKGVVLVANCSIDNNGTCP